MAKNLTKQLDRYSYLATGARKVILFYQNNKAIIDMLFEISFMDGLGFLLYIGILSYLWYDFIKQQHPVLYGTLLHMHRNYMICSKLVYFFEK